MHSYDAFASHFDKTRHALWPGVVGTAASAHRSARLI